MTRHPRRSHHQRQENQQQDQQKKEKGWYCIAHDARHPCDVCGYENIHKQKEPKYYFVEEV